MDSLHIVANQNAPLGFPYYVLTGSTGGSQDVVKKYGFEHENFTVEFGHGKTRNLGAAKLVENLLFFSPRAIPQLLVAKELTEPLREDDDYGAFSKHIATTMLTLS